MIPAKSQRSGRHRRAALVLPPLLLVVALVLVPAGTGADGPGGQSSTYTAPRQDIGACTIYSPQFASDTAALFNDTRRSASVAVEVRELEGGPRYDRTLNVGAGSANQVSERSLELPTAFTVGSFMASVPTPTPTPTPTPAAPGEAGADTLNPMGTGAEIWFQAAQFIPQAQFPTRTPVPTVTPVQVHTATPIPRLTATPTLVPGCGLSAVVYRDTATGDRWADEAIPETDAANQVFIPLVHRADRNFDTDVVIMNVARSSDVTVNLIYRPDLETGTDARELASLTIPAQTSVKAVFPGGVPRAISALEIDGHIGARLVAAAYTTGPQGMAASHPGISRTGTAPSIAVPLLFKASGYENGYTSRVRVMKVFATGGAAEPTITLWDRDTGERIGPIPATRPDGSLKALLEGQGHTWDLAQIRELRDGRVYSAVVNSETISEVAVTVEQVNMRRGTLSAYTGSPIKEPVTLLPEPFIDPITGRLIPVNPRGVPGAPGGPGGPPFIDPLALAPAAGGEAAVAAAAPGAGGPAGSVASNASGIPPAAPIPGALPTLVTITKELPKRLSAPLVVKNAGGLNSGIAVQNLSRNDISVVVTFYDVEGHLRLQHAATGVPGEGSATIYLPFTDLPDGFVGRADIAASGPIAAVVHTARYR